MSTDDLTELITQAIRDADADTLDYERRAPDSGYGTHAAAVMSVVAPAIQAAKAEALREAADDIDFNLGRGYTGADDRDATAAAEVWLRDRAEQIKKENPR